MNRKYPLEWPTSEAEDIVFQARRHVREILSSHRPPELKPEVKQAIQAILFRIGGDQALF
jgi:trimethylamine:corrinoid methyltransferase-like protein